MTEGKISSGSNHFANKSMEVLPKHSINEANARGLEDLSATLSPTQVGSKQPSISSPQVSPSKSKDLSGMSPMNLYFQLLNLHESSRKYREVRGKKDINAEKAEAIFTFTCTEWSGKFWD